MKRHVCKAKHISQSLLTVTAEKVSSDALLSRMWRRNAIHAVHKTLRMQELWPIGDAAGTDGTQRKEQAPHRF